MNNKPLISVIVPVYNVEQYLDECISTIVSQSYSNLEIIIVDDGAKDGSPALCDKWAKIDSRIKVIHKENGGLSSARNAGIDIATGQYIGFVDSDDTIDKNMYEVLISPFLQNDNVGITSVKVLRDKEGVKSPFFMKCEIHQDRIIEGCQYAREMILQNACWTAWNKLYDINVIKALRFKEGRNNEDTLFMYGLGFHMKESGKVLYEVAYPGYFYRIRSESICTNEESPLVFDIIKNLEEMMINTPTAETDLLRCIKIKYIDTITEQLDGMLFNQSRSDKYRSFFIDKMISIPFIWILTAAPNKTKLHYLLHRYFPKGRKMMFDLLSK